jgi:hypothetical protein
MPPSPGCTWADTGRVLQSRAQATAAKSFCAGAVGEVREKAGEEVVVQRFMVYIQGLKQRF